MLQEEATENTMIINSSLFYNQIFYITADLETENNTNNTNNQKRQKLVKEIEHLFQALKKHE